MHCPFCRHTDSRVMDSRATDDGSSIRRRRQCPECGRRFTTVETASLSVVKRSGATEPFSRAKVLVGVRKACQGRPVTEDDLALLAQRVEETIRSQGSAEIDAHEVGLAVLEPLRELDEVAYLRFASRLPGLRLPRGLRVRHHPAARRARRHGAGAARAGCRPRTGATAPAVPADRHPHEPARQRRQHRHHRAPPPNSLRRSPALSDPSRTIDHRSPRPPEGQKEGTA